MKSARIFLFLVAGCALCWAQDYEAGVWNHNPKSEIGPPNWANLPDSKTCGTGTTQSPIKLPPKDTLKPGPENVEFHYTGKVTAEVWNTQHVIEVCALKGAPLHECKGESPKDIYITVKNGPKGKDFYLKEFHLHAPAEHTYNGREPALEVHLVHVATDGAVAVIGILMNRVSSGGNGVVKDVIDNVPGAATVIKKITVDPNGLVQAARQFYAYKGSLTTPACKEGLSWFVATTETPANQDDILKLHGIIAAFKDYDKYPNNNRRPMPALNERPVALAQRLTSPK